MSAAAFRILDTHEHVYSISPNRYILDVPFSLINIHAKERRLDLFGGSYLVRTMPNMYY